MASSAPAPASTSTSVRTAAVASASTSAVVVTVGAAKTSTWTPIGNHGRSGRSGRSARPRTCAEIAGSDQPALVGSPDGVSGNASTPHDDLTGCAADDTVNRAAS